MKQDPATVDTFLLSISHTDPALWAMLGAHGIREICYRVLVIQKFQEWQKSLADYKPALAAGDPESEAK